MVSELDFGCRRSRTHQAPPRGVPLLLLEWVVVWGACLATVQTIVGDYLVFVSLVCETICTYTSAVLADSRKAAGGGFRMLEILYTRLSDSVKDQHKNPRKPFQEGVRKSRRLSGRLTHSTNNFWV